MEGSTVTNNSEKADAPSEILPSGSNSESDATSEVSSSADASVVYFTSDISAEGLVRLYEVLGWTPTGNVAVKISTGEPPASNYLRPELIGDLVQMLDGTIVECNTAKSFAFTALLGYPWYIFPELLDFYPLGYFR